VDRHRLRKLLEEVRRGRTSVDEATHALADLPFAELGYATVDTHRSVRFGFPEVVYGEGKAPEQLLGIVEVLVRRKQPVLVTRLTEEKAAPLLARWPKARWHPEARILHLAQGRPRAGRVAVTCAGTSDVPVAEEAALTAEAMGATVARIYDVGVAGLHRLLSQNDRLQQARVIVAVAGMEGALASVITGLVAVPVISVPTSVGYGASFHGLAALLAMLNSCANGMAVVNIDNGFGAGYFAGMLNQMFLREKQSRGL
jgi:NCAIR mutase (PurE)-related protein